MRGDQSFLFADLSGFTALTEAHGDEDAADLAAEFTGAVGELLPARDAHEVKTIGDALMLRVPDAAQAIYLGLEIVQRVGGQHGFPSIRVGMHTGPAVERAGDWFGATVNIAARVASVARGDEVLLTEPTRAAAGDLERVELRDWGRHALRNVAEPLRIFSAVPTGREGAVGLPIDPVCRMAVDPTHAAGVLSHRGIQYHFCSLRCAHAFASEPERYAAARG